MFYRQDKCFPPEECDRFDRWEHWAIHILIHPKANMHPHYFKAMDAINTFAAGERLANNCFETRLTDLGEWASRDVALRREPPADIPCIHDANVDLDVRHPVIREYAYSHAALHVPGAGSRNDGGKAWERFCRADTAMKQFCFRRERAKQTVPAIEPNQAARPDDTAQPPALKDSRL